MKLPHLIEEENLRRTSISRNYIYNPSPPLEQGFQQNYADVKDLLKEKLANFLRLNDKLRRNIISRKRFVDNTYEAISFNFSEFKEPYKVKFLDPDFEKYCDTFIEFLKPVLLDFVKEVQFGGYAFKIEIRYKANKFDKTISILNKVNDDAIEE